MQSLLTGDDETIVPRLLGLHERRRRRPAPAHHAGSLAIAKGTGNLEATPADVVRLVNVDRGLKNDVLSTVPLEPLPLPDGRTTLRPDRSGLFSIGELDGCTLFLFNTPKIALVSPSRASGRRISTTGRRKSPWPSASTTNGPSPAPSRSRRTS